MEGYSSTGVWVLVVGRAISQAWAFHVQKAHLCTAHLAQKRAHSARSFFIQHAAAPAPPHPLLRLCLLPTPPPPPPPIPAPELRNGEKASNNGRPHQGDGDNDASASHKRKREATADDDILLDLDTDKMVDDDIFPDLYTDKMVDDDILPDLDADKMVDDDILPDLDANNMEDLDKIVELDKIKILDLMHHHSWATSPESGAYAMGAWGPGLWSSSSASMPFTGRYIDTWCRGYSEDDCFLCVTGEHGVTFKKADEAIIHASIQPGSTMILESKYNVMVFGRSPSSLLFCMNSGEDLRAFGKRTHWSVANVGAEFTSQEYFEKMKVQIKYAEFMGLEEEKNATEAFYVPFSAYNMDRYPDLQNAGLIQDFDNFRDLVLPGLWEDIYDTYKGHRSVELSNVISALVQSMVKKIDVTKLSGGQASLPTGITWWLNMDRERRDDMTAFYF